MDSSTKSTLGFVGFMIFAGVVVGLGAGTMWVGLLVFVALVLLLIAAMSAARGRMIWHWVMEFGAFVALTLVWRLTPPRSVGWAAGAWFLCAAVALLFAFAVEDSSASWQMRGAAFLFAVFGVVTLLYRPAALFGGVSAPGIRMDFSGVGQWFALLWSQIGMFVIPVVTSAWGIVSLLFVVALGWLWWRGKGAVGLPVALAIVIPLVGTFRPGLTTTAAEIMTASPVARMEGLLTAQWLALAPGAAVVFAAAFVTLLLAPTHRFDFRASLAIGQEMLRREATGGASLMDQPVITEDGIRSGLGSVLMGVVVAWGAIALWIALHLADVPVLAFPGLAWDLSVPDITPAFTVPSAILAASQIAYLFYLRRQEWFADRALGGRYWTAMLITSGMVAVAAALFVPSGVLLWSVSISWLFVGVGWLVTIDLRREQQLAAPATAVAYDDGGPAGGVSAGEDEAGATSPTMTEEEAQDAIRILLSSDLDLNPETPTPPRPEEREEQLPGPPGDDATGGGAGEPSVVPPPIVEPPYEPPPVTRPVALPGEVVLFRGEGPISSIVPLQGGGFAVLEESGQLTRVLDGEEVSGLARVVDPLGLLPTAEGRVAIADRRGRIAEYGFAGGEVTQTNACATGSTLAAAVNKYGTQVAYTNDEPGVRSWVIADGSKRELARDLEGVRSIAYSHAGSRLWAVVPPDRLVCLDLKSGSSDELVMPEGAQAIATQPDGVIAVALDRLVRVTPDGVAGEWKISSAPTTVATDLSDGRVAAGSSKGYVRVRSADLGTTVFDGKVTKGAVVSLAFVDGDVVVAAKDATVRIVAL